MLNHDHSLNDALHTEYVNSPRHQQDSIGFQTAGFKTLLGPMYPCSISDGRIIRQNLRIPADKWPARTE